MKKIFIKSITIILLISLLIGIGAPVLFKSKKANAQILSVPTSEVPLPTSSTFSKEWISDAIVRAAVRAAVVAMVNEIANWARGGFRASNQPFAIASWENYLKRAVNIGSARFIEEFGLTELCLPFRDILGQRLGLGVLDMYQPIYQEYAACTIERITGNAQEFFDNPSISKYGWGAWTALAQPQNNIFGSFLLATQRKAGLEDESKAAKEKEGTVSGGYENFTECMKRGSMGICIDSMLRTTGTEIHDLLEEATRSDLEWLISADEISELITAFIAGFWNRLREGFYNVYDPYEGINIPDRPTPGEYPPIDIPLPNIEVPETKIPEMPKIPEIPGPEIPGPEEPIPQ